MANTYDIELTDGTLDFTIDEKQVVVDHGLTFTGRGVADYGEHRNTNLLHLAEHFASDVSPVNPVTGQVWFDTASSSVNVFDGISFAPVGSDDFVIAGTYQTGAITPNEANLPKSLTADVIITNIAEWSDFNAHIIDVTAAHNATNIFFDDSGVAFVANDVQEAIEDTQNLVLEDHLTSGPAPGDASHAATAISFTPTGTISATTVQAAIQEVENDVDVTQATNNIVQTAVNNHIADTVAAHAATAISYDNSTSGLTATDVQAAIDEIAIGGISGSGSGYVDCVRVTTSSNQLIDAGAGGGALGVAETLEFNNIVDGDALGNFDDSPANWLYRADRPMQVRVRAYVRYLALTGNQVGYVIIRKNGGIVRRGVQLRLASDDVGTASITIEASWIDDLATNDEVDVQAQMQSFGGTTDKEVQSGRVNTGFEVEVLSDLSP